MILQLLKLIMQIFGVAMEERQKAIKEGQKYDLDETAMLHIVVSAIHRLREKAPLESQMAQDLESKIEAEATSESPRPECVEESCRSRSES